MSHVYFIQSGPDGPIKIGVAIDPDQRLALMQVGTPEKLYLRALIAGGYAEEKYLHDRFAPGRIRGEWFEPNTEGLGEFISSARHLEFFPRDRDHG